MAKLDRFSFCTVLTIMTASFFGFGSAVQAQDQTLADIRQELSVVYVDIQRLKRELSTTGSAAGVENQGSLLERIETIEAQLRSVTSQTEEVELRLERVVSDGTNRIGDLEFRICELEASCDISTLTMGSTLGGEPSNESAPEPKSDDVQLAVGEEADFAAAQTAFDSGNFTEAAQSFERFTTNYPGSHLSPQAHFLRGSSFEALSETAPAARAFLDSFSGAPDGPYAPEALYKLGISLGALGQKNEACLMLGEVEARFPTASIVSEAQAAMMTMECN